MAFAAWKRIERNPGYQRAKTQLKRLVGRELSLRVELRIKAEKDSFWWFAPEELDHNSIVYSLGVGEDIDFDLSIIDRYQLELHAFDPTPSSIDMLKAADLPQQFNFHPWAITAEDGTLMFYPRVRKDGSVSEVMFTMIAEDGSVDDGIEVPAFCLSSVVNELGHERIDLLKMDIEGAEYEVLEGLLASPIKPRQLLVEFHHRFAAIGLQKTADMVARLRDAGYKIFVVSETGREVGFLLAD